MSPSRSYTLRVYLASYAPVLYGSVRCSAIGTWRGAAVPVGATWYSELRRFRPGFQLK